MAGIRDPFARPDGSRAGTPEEFYENRAYLKELMQRYVYGYMPALPRKAEVSEIYREDILGGAAVNEYRTISFDGLSIKVRIAYPKGAKKLPAIMRLDYLCGRTDKPQGKLYEYEPKALKIKEENKADMEQFIDMCFDPSSPASVKMKEAMMKLLIEKEDK